MTGTNHLSPRQKAAVIVRLLLDGDDPVPLSSLPGDAQAMLAEEMAGMHLVDRATRDAVVQEFCDMLDRVGVTFPGDLDSTLDMLGQQLSHDTTDRLRRLAALTSPGDPWLRIAALPVDTLVTLACNEAVEIGALMLAKLPVGKASECFGKLAHPRARAVAQAMSLTGDVTRPALQRIGHILLRAADALPRPAIESPAVERVGALLNFAAADLREEILQGLDAEDAGFADGVRKAIFTFRHIPQRIEARSVPQVARAVDNAVLVRALAGAAGEDAASAAFILANLPQRLAESLRGDIDSLGKVRPRDAEDAMASVVAAIRQMVDDGDLALIEPGAEDEQAA